MQKYKNNKLVDNVNMTLRNMLGIFSKEGGIYLNHHRLFKDNFLAKNKTEEMQMLIFYRALSVVITSFFYFIGDFDHSIQRKLFIMGTICISAALLTYLYANVGENKKKIKLLVLLETAGNCLILIPSGGLNSPYVWYALNTIMITSIKLDNSYCFLNMVAYLFISIEIMHMGSGRGVLALVEAIKLESNRIISFILIAVAMQRLSTLSKDVQRQSEKVSKANEELEAANFKIKESVEHIMSLYQTVNSLSTQKNDDRLMELFVHYSKLITKAETIFFMNAFQCQNSMIIEKNQEEFMVLKDQLRNEILNKWNSLLRSEIPIELDIEGKIFVITILKSAYKVYGILGIESITNKEDIAYKENVDQLKFLANLGAIVLERAHLEEVNDRLVIAQEQNRIANEIHDSVLQRLYSMSFSIFSLMKNIEKVNGSQIKKELNALRSAMDSAMKELRSTIYGLSWQKNGIDTFNEDILNYIHEIQALRNIDIALDIKGNHAFLTVPQKKAIYRIICEGIGNAVRHGNSTEIQVMLDIRDDLYHLEIKDNGIGFEVSAIREDPQVGLGLKNIQYLVKSLGGELCIDSVVGEGTSIMVDIYNQNQILEKVNAV